MVTHLERPSLTRQLGGMSATALVVSSMIGTGIFSTTGFLAGDLGTPSLVLWSWVAGAVFALLGSLCYAELGMNLPESGGEYVYLSRAYGPIWGFMSGWVSFFAGFSAPVAVAALAFASYLGQVCAACADDKARILLRAGEWSFQFGKTQMIACCLVVLLTIVNVLGVRGSKGLQNVFTIAKIAILAAFIVLAFTVGHGSWQHFAQSTARTSSSPLPAQFAISLFYIYLSYSGWNAATYVAGEIRDPGRTLPRALMLGTGLVAALYLILNVLYIYAAPLTSLRGQVAVGALAASNLFGPGVATAFSALMALSLVASVNAQVMTGPRVYFAMAQNGAFFPSAAKIHPRWRTPWMAIVAQGICTLVMTTTSLPDLLQYIGFTLSFFTALGVASLFHFRRQAGWKKLRAVNVAWPLVPILFLLPEVWIIIFGLQLKPFISLAGAATIAAGALAYRFGARRISAPGDLAVTPPE